MEEEAATVSKLIKGLATLEKVKEKVEEENQLSMIGGKSETGSPYLRIWGSSRSLDALNHTPLVEMVVVPEEEDGVISCTLVSFRRDPIHSATFVTTDLDARTGLPCFLDYLQTRLGRSYSLCKGLAEATLPSSLPGHQSFNKCLVEREPNGGGHLLLRSRLCQVVRPGGAEDEDQCPACAQLFDKSLATPESSRFKDQPDPGREKSKSCPFESCSRTFRREKPYQRHLKSHNQLKCSSCKKIFASDSQLSTHMKRAHRQKEGNKDIADPGGTSLDHLSDRGEHEKCATEEAPQQSKQFSCGQCGAAYQYEKAFQKHFQTHRDDVGTDIFNCDQCNQIYQTEVQLKEHKENTHTPFVCDQCDSVSSSSKALEKHKRKMHPKAQDQCHLCGKNVKRTSMSSHVKMVHQGDEMRRHICNVCGNKYKTKTDLDRHYTKHTGQRHYTCPTCGKGFRFWGGLDDCLRRHEGSLRHSCTTCGKGFNSKFRLLVHQRTHSGARPFQCPCCNYDCARKDNLLTHIRRSHRLTQAEAEILGNQNFLKESAASVENPETCRENIDDEIDLHGNSADEPLDMSSKEKDKSGLA